MAANLAGSELKDWFMADMRPELVSPVVTYLAHRDCAVTGELFVVGGGRVARTVLAETQGFVDRELAPETVRDRLPDAMDTAHLTFPADTTASLLRTAAALGRHLTDTRLGAGPTPNPPGGPQR